MGLTVFKRNQNNFPVVESLHVGRDEKGGKEREIEITEKGYV